MDLALFYLFFFFYYNCRVENYFFAVSGSLNSTSHIPIMQRYVY